MRCSMGENCFWEDFEGNLVGLKKIILVVRLIHLQKFFIFNSQLFL